MACIAAGAALTVAHFPAAVLGRRPRGAGCHASTELSAQPLILEGGSTRGGGRGFRRENKLHSFFNGHWRFGHSWKSALNVLKNTLWASSDSIGC